MGLKGIKEGEDGGTGVGGGGLLQSVWLETVLEELLEPGIYITNVVIHLL